MSNLGLLANTRTRSKKDDEFDDPQQMKPENGGDATGFQDLGGGVRETENVRERREESRKC